MKIVNYKLKILRSFFISMLLLSVVSVGSVFAQTASESRTITIVPPGISHDLNPGQNAEGILKVVNDGSEPLVFKASTQDFVVEDEFGTPSLLPPDYLSKKFSGASWIGIYPNEFTVMPHSRQQLNYYMQIPADARPGGHYAAVVYTPTNNMGVAGTGASVETKIGTLFYITVNGPIREQSFVSKFFANSFQEYGPVKITTQIKNMGDLHVKPVGAIAVNDILGRIIAKENLSQHNVFPTASREYVNLAGQKLMIGPFKANLTAYYGKEKLPLTATVYFWVFPWKVSVIIILIIIAAVLGWKYWKTKKIRTDSKRINTDESK